jgi:hypothetical protein
VKRYIPILALPLLMGGCMWTDSAGQQIVLTPQNAIPLVAAKVKAGCAFYDANKVTAEQVETVATQAVNNATVTGVVETVDQIAAKACPLLEALLPTVTVTPAATNPAPAVTSASG